MMQERYSCKKGKLAAVFPYALRYGLKLPECPNPVPEPEYALTRSDYCASHREWGHSLQNCIELEDALDKMIKEETLILPSYFFIKKKPRSDEKSNEGTSTSSNLPTITNPLLQLVARQEDQIAILMEMVETQRQTMLEMRRVMQKQEGLIQQQQQHLVKQQEVIRGCTQEGEARVQNVEQREIDQDEEGVMVLVI